MSIYATQRNATNNQSTVDYLVQNIFTYGNRYGKGIFVNNLGESLDAQDGILVVRNSGSFETATIKFNVAGLTAGQTQIIAGLTFTSTGVTTQAQLAAAFANLAVGATTGAGSALGTYSGALTGYSTGAVITNNTVVFTASTVGPKTDLTETGTGADPTITVVNGTAGVDEGFSPATSATLANVIGILKTTGNGITTLADGASMSANYAICGDIDATMLVLPNGVTLDSIVGSKALKDILTALDFRLNDVVEMTKFNN
jgi:S-layer protein